MRRRLARLLSVSLLAMALVLPASVATAAPVEAATAEVATVVLAAEGGEPAGLEPRSADDEENEFAPEPYQENFLWGAAVGLLAIVLAILGGLGGLYWLLVVRPSQQPTRTGS
jgi:hypothetical protein